MRDKVMTYSSGLIIGMLVAAVAVGTAVDKGMLFPEQAPVVKTLTVTKTNTVVKTRTVTKVVTKEAKPKIYRASLLDDNGKVLQTWIVRSCQFRIIGAVLTDMSGKEFDVDGNVSIEPIK